MNVTIIQVYAPTSDYDDNVIEEFYETIEDAISKKPKKDLHIVQGDWNAIVGSGKHNWGNAIGQFSTGVTNERGNRLLEFATKNSLDIIIRYNLNGIRFYIINFYLLGSIKKKMLIQDTIYPEIQILHCLTNNLTL